MAVAGAWAKEVGARLRWVRELAAESQVGAARLLNCDQGSFSKWEDGSRVLPTRVALRMCEVWGVTLDYLYRGKLDAAVRRDLAVMLAADHPELVDRPSAPARHAKAAAPAS